MKNLTKKQCQPSEGIGRAFNLDEARSKIDSIPEWVLSADGKMISRAYVAKNFIEAVNFIGKIAEIAEDQSHHPDIHLTGYRNVKIDLSTHALNGLTENDLIVAAKINEIELIG